jgi:hypothetical protein
VRKAKKEIDLVLNRYQPYPYSSLNIWPLRGLNRVHIACVAYTPTAVSPTSLTEVKKEEEAI